MAHSLYQRKAPGAEKAKVMNINYVEKKGT